MFNEPCEQLPVRGDLAWRKKILAKRTSRSWQQRERVCGMFEAVRRSRQGDVGGFLQMLAAPVRFLHGCEESLQEANEVFLFRESKGFGHPPPGMLVYRIAWSQDSGQVLRVDGQELFRLRELRPRVLDDNRQKNLSKTVPMRGNVMAISVTRPKNFEDGCLEWLNRLVDERGVLREKPLLLFND